MPTPLPSLPPSVAGTLSSLQRRRHSGPLGGPATPDMPRPGRRVLITGGASGLGLSLARACLERGDRVAIADLAPAVPRPAEIPDHALYIQMDVRSESDWIDAREQLLALWGGLDVLVNNAGIAQGGRIDRLTEQDWQDIVNTNLLGVARGCRLVVPVFKKQGHGHVVNIASLAGLVHPPAMSSYSAVKAGVVAMSECLRWELQPHGITVSVVCPAFMRTNLASSLSLSDPLAHSTAVKLIDRSNLIPDQVAAVVVHAIDSGKFLILPDRHARSVRATMKAAPWAVSKALRDAGRKLARKAEEKDDAAPY